MWGISIAVLICLLAGPAFSNPPSPTPSNAEQNPQADTKDKQDSSSTDLRGTETSPLFIKVIPALTIEPRPSEHAEESHWYSSPEWWLVIITGLLTVATIILAGYTAQLWGATKTLAEDAKGTAAQQAKDVKESLRIARETSERQAGEMQESLRIARESSATAVSSVDVARQEFISTHRPKIVVRRVSCDEAMSNAPEISLQLHLTMTNVGATSATIYEISAILIDIPSSLPAGPPYGDHSTWKIVLNGGESHTDIVHISTSNDIVGKFNHADGFGSCVTSIYCLGYIMYEDSLHRRYRTAFMRRYNAETKRFYGVIDPDYEYQD